MENDLTGNEKYFELTGGSSYRGTFFFNHLADTFEWLLIEEQLSHSRPHE